MAWSIKNVGGLVALSLSVAASSLAQAPTQTDKERAEQAALRAASSREVPEASLSSTTEEAKWWKDLRAASKTIRPTRAAKKETDEFIRLIREASEKSYQIPVPDRSATILWREPPRYTEEARNKQIKGSVAMAAELLPDGTVGEVKVVQSLDPGLDEMALAAARKVVFLPMVKGRKFVTVWMPMTMSFNIR